MRDRFPFGIAGIWENWKNPQGEWVRTFAVLTTPANELVARVHDRMPIIFEPRTMIAGWGLNQTRAICSSPSPQRK
jgi:putative SOS response-associated peptidase YedK